MLKPNSVCIYLGMLIMALIVMGCGKKQEPQTAPPQAPAAPSAPGSQAPEASPPQAAPAPQPAAHADVALAKANPGDTYVISANPELKGRLGQMVVAFPKGASASNTRTFVYKEQNAITDFYGDKTVELLPGTYAVAITGKRVEGITIQSGHDSKVKVGMLRVAAGKDTRVFLLDTDKTRVLTDGYGNQELGFPIGTVYVSIAGQSEAVTIKDGQITDF